MPMFPVLLSAVFLLLLMYVQFRWRHRHILSAATKLPCPPALPFVGNALFFIGGITNITKTIIQFTTQMKGLFCIWIGPVPVFVVSDPADAQVVLNSSNTLERDDIYAFLKPYLGNGLLTAPVHTWKKARRVISPVLHPSNVEKFLPMFNDVSRQLIRGFTNEGLLLDPRDGIFNASMDAVMRTVIARKPPDSETKKNTQYLLNTVGRMFTCRLFKPWLHLDWLFNLLYWREVKKAQETMAACLRFIDQEWKDEERMRNAAPESNQGSSVKNMLDICFGISPEGLEDHNWIDEVTTMIVGATDTVVAALSFALISLANCPEAQSKIYAEIQEVMGDCSRDVTLAELNSMTYLSQAIMEAIRLHGIFPVILRRATRDTKLSACTLPAGSQILVALHAMGWEAERFPQPEKFLPERFSPEALTKNGKEKHNYAFLPFSGGPRNCLGKTYAMLIIKTMMVHILSRYRLRMDMQMEDIEYELKVVMFSKTPLLLGFEPR